MGVGFVINNSDFKVVEFDHFNYYFITFNTYDRACLFGDINAKSFARHYWDGIGWNGNKIISNDKPQNNPQQQNRKLDESSTPTQINL